ncbi:hypothetical protein SFRURICE_008247 [Spodoptera frugiperda]|nr:hypothetical protein SFRURICE_008247 [Spodoptera frugiperda]
MDAALANQINCSVLITLLARLVFSGSAEVVKLRVTARHPADNGACARRGRRKSSAPDFILLVNLRNVQIERKPQGSGFNDKDMDLIRDQDKILQFLNESDSENDDLELARQPGE